jgi:RHS repeat-associated protein
MADADGVGREFKHDDFGEIVEEVLGGDAAWRHVFNRFGELVASRDPTGGGLMQEIDDRGDVRVIRTRGGTRAELAWDEQHNLVRVEVSGEAPLGARYDGLGRLRAVFLPDGHSVNYELDLCNRPVSIMRSWLGADRFEYDAAGLVQRHVGPGGGGVDYEYTNYNRIAAMRTSIGERRFEYNLEGDVTAIVNERGERYVLERDSEGQVVAETDFTGRTRRYRLNGAGHAIEIVEPGGRRVKQEWTPGGRLAAIRYPDGSFDSFTYDGKGEVVAAENENGAVERAFDAAGRIVREAAPGFSVEHEYDTDGQLIRSSASDGRELEFGYDEGGRLSELVADGRWELRRTFDTLGLLQEVQRPGRITERLRYDGNGWPLEQHVAAVDGRNVAYRRYEFNAAGFLAGLYDSARGLRTFAFGPGGLERVLRDGRVEESYVHDVAGDWFPADEPAEAGPGGRIERFGDIRYEYDAEGRIVRRTQAGRTWEFTWNDRGQMIATKTPEGREIRYTYDPFWRRIQREDGEVTTHWAWDGNAPVRERRIAKGGESARAFVFEPDGHAPLLALQGDDCAGFVGDHIGTPQEVVSTNGDVLWAGDYSAFGRLLRARTAGFENPFRFQGQWYDDETGLHYNRFRYYDPETGRYLSPDPIRLAGGMSAYAYTGNPLTWVDPLGLSCGRVGEFFQSFVVFFRSGIRPRDARAIMRLARETGQTFAFRNISTFRRRIGSFVAGLFGMRPKPMSTKAKSNGWGVATDPHTGQQFRSDYDPTFYRNPDGSVMTNEQADAANRALNDAIGGPEIQHPTHVTMPEDVAPKVGPPTESTVFHPDGSTSQMTPDQIRDSPGMPWMW